MASAVSALLADIGRIRTQLEELAEATDSETTTAQLAELKRQEQQKLADLADAAADAEEQAKADAAAAAAAEAAEAAAAAAAASGTQPATSAEAGSGAGTADGANGLAQATQNGVAANGAQAAPGTEATAGTSMAGPSTATGAWAASIAGTATAAQAADGAAAAAAANSTAQAPAAAVADGAADERPAKRARSATDPIPSSQDLLAQLMAGGGLPDSIVGEPGPDAVQNAPMAGLLTSWKLLEQGELLAAEGLPSSRTAPKGPFLLSVDLARKVEASLLATDIRSELLSEDGGGVGRKLPLGRLLRTRTLRNEAVQYIRKELPAGHVLRTLDGKLTGEGGILCGCEDCNGCNEVPPSVFEEHSGSLAKKPADNIFVLRYGVSLKDLLTSVTAPQLDSTNGLCLLCGRDEDLLQCEQCDCTFHAACCDWPELSGAEVPCPACLMQAAADNVELQWQQQEEEEEGVGGAPGAGDDSATESDTEMLDAAKTPTVKAEAVLRPGVSVLPMQLRAGKAGA